MESRKEIRVSLHGIAHLFLLALSLVSTLVAHHTSAEFDANKTIVVTGKLVKLDWRNPHSYMNVEVTDVSGRKLTWTGETGSPLIHTRFGWTHEGAMKLIGQTVTLRGNASKDGTRHIGAATLTTEKGAVLSVSIRTESNGQMTYNGSKVRAENGVVVTVKD